MTELVDWLRQQLDEDELVARGATAGPWNAECANVQTAYEFDRPGHIHNGQRRPIAYLAATAGKREVEERNAEHIARWDPARVLAEVEAKRRVLDLHAPARRRLQLVPEDGNGTTTFGFYVCPICVPHIVEHGQDFDEGPCRTVRLLAQPYAGRPGWREEWQLR